MMVLLNKRPIQNEKPMKTKIILFIAAVATVTLSFTFVAVEKPSHKTELSNNTTANPEIGGFVSDAVVK
jgi:hypothetical protein